MRRWQALGAATMLAIDGTRRLDSQAAATRPWPVSARTDTSPMGEPSVT